MKKYFLLTVLWLCNVWPLIAQTLHKPIGANYSVIAAYSPEQADIFSFTSNPAALAQFKISAAGIYAERRYLLNELNNYMTVAGITTPSGNFALQAGYYGFTAYNESQLGLAYGRKLNDKAAIGARFNYYGIRIAGYGNASAIGFELGTMLYITDQLRTGVHVTNPVGGKFGIAYQEKVPAIWTAGFGYEPSEKVLLFAEAEKEEDRPVNINAGLQYKIIPQLLLRGGLATSIPFAWLGVGLLWRNARLDIITNYHPQLGITPALQWIFHFKRKEN